MTSPLTPAASARATRTDLAAVRSALKATSGNVGLAAIVLGCNRRRLDMWIVALGLRAWLTTAYPRSVRQPRRAPA